MDIWFSNREADLAGFVRHHLLSGELLAVLAELAGIAGDMTPESALRADAYDCLAQG